MTDALASGERVIWRGRPTRLRGFYRPMDPFMLAFVFLGALFFVTALSSSARSRPADAGDYQVAILFPLIVFGLFFFLPRFIGVWREKSGAEYTLTNKRVLLTARGRRIEFDLRSLPHLELERSWLSGPTIFFAQRNLYDGFGWYGGSNAPAFRGLPDAEQVYEMIGKARTEALGG